MEKAERIQHQPTADELRKYRELREMIESEKDEIIADGRRHKAVHDNAVQCLRDAVALLKQERLAQQLDVDQLCDQSGLDRNGVLRLESDPEPQTPISTLIRYAHCLGKRMNITFDNVD